MDATDVVWLRERASAEGMTRSRLSVELCNRKGWYDGLGRSRAMAGRVAIGRAAREYEIALPEAQRVVPAYRRPKTLNRDKPHESFPKGANVEDARLELVTTKQERRLWREMLDERHYLGAGPLCGAQLRYIVYLNDVAVGGLAFSSAAYALSARDKWIGWSEAARKQNLSRIVCNSRFLLKIRKYGLASSVLNKALCRLPTDWHDKYGVKPLLVETFVEKDRYHGTCYQAANWEYVGETSGRGRNDPTHSKAVPIKRVFVYPLDESWRKILCREPVRNIADEQSWAATEFGSVDLGDERLTARVVTIAQDFFSKPTVNIPQACGDRAKTKAVYRLCSNSKATMTNLLSGHVEATLSRCTNESRVFAIQDTTTLNYSTHLMTEDLGPIGSFGAQATLGLLLHSTFMLSGGDTPLGLLDAQCWARSSDQESYGKSESRYNLPIEDKESFKWIKGFRAVVEAGHRAPNTEFVVMGDREADVFELFDEHRKSAPKNVHLLIRACHPRKIRLDSGEDGYLWDYVSAQPSQGEMLVQVPRRGNRAARQAKLELRCSEVTVLPPDKLRGKQYEPIRLYAIAAQEVSAPEGVEALKWLLLSTMPINTVEEASEKVTWYTKRWQIEVFHRTLKSGCRIENRQLCSAHSIQAALSIDIVVAWRIFHLAKLGREVPDAPCTIFFEECEWKALMCFVNKTPIPPKEPPSLKDALIKVATLGGFLGRKRDGMPGTQTLWRGLERLSDISSVCSIFFDST